MHITKRGRDGQPREFILTDAELDAFARFHRMLDNGASIPFAAQIALNTMIGLYHPRQGAPAIDQQFVDYLSHGTVMVQGQRFHVKPEWQPVTP